MKLLIALVMVVGCGSDLHKTGEEVNTNLNRFGKSFNETLNDQKAKITEALIGDSTDGSNGKDGDDGIDGTNGSDGYDGTNGTDGIDGTNGSDGIDGESCSVFQENLTIKGKKKFKCRADIVIECDDGSEELIVEQARVDCP